MRSEAGFTLIEILVGGVISTVLAGGMLSLFYLVTDNIKESTANSRLLRIQTVAEDQLRRTVRRAYAVKVTQTELSRVSGRVDVSSIAAEDPNTYTGLKVIWLYEAEPDALIGAYRITFGNSIDTLLELRNGVFAPMHIGSDTVWINGTNSSFSILPNRRGVSFDLRYGIQENGNSYVAPVLIDSVLCRGKI
jgi:type II secretory pathway pseudopilin PulG